VFPSFYRQLDVRTAGLALTDQFAAGEENLVKYIFFYDPDKLFTPRLLFSDELNVYTPKS